MMPTQAQMGEAMVPRDAPALADAAEGALTDDDLLLAAAGLASIGTLTRTVAHEINNPLLAILGLIDFVIEDVEPDTEPHAFLQLIQKNGLEIKRVVRTLLDFTREPSQGQSAISLANVAADAVALARAISPVSFASLTESYADIDTPVHGNANQLKQVFLHLLRHAERTMLEGGTVRIATTRQADSVSAVVSETGGRPTPTDAERAEDIELGAGLAISRAILSIHGGALDVRRRSERVDFILRLPAHNGGL